MEQIKDFLCEVSPTVCLNEARYKCPKCQVRFCSSACYGKHSNECVIAFREDERKALQGKKVSNVERRRFIKFLKNAQESITHMEDFENHKYDMKRMCNSKIPVVDESSEDVDNENDNEDYITDELEVLLEDMELSDMSYEEILERLPVPMQNDFENRLREGRVQDIVSPWIPWWKPGDVDNDKTQVNDSEMENSLPPLPNEKDLIISVSDARRIASPLLIFNIVDILATYAFTMLSSNGDWRGDVIGAACDMWTVSAVLAEDARHSNIQDVCRSVVARAGRSVGNTILRAAVEILSETSCAVARALFDSVTMFREVVEQHKTDLNMNGKERKHFKNALRKLGFFTAWTLAEPSDQLLQIAHDLLSVTDLQAGDREDNLIARQALNTKKSNQKGALWIS